MRVLLDTNVLLDFLLAREPFASDARGIWLACEQGRCTGYLAAISVTNIWYKCAYALLLQGGDALLEITDLP